MLARCIGKGGLAGRDLRLTPQRQKQDDRVKRSDAETAADLFWCLETPTTLSNTRGYLTACD